MNKLEIIKDKLKMIIKECEEVEGCHMCSYSKKCRDMDDTDSPASILEYIERVEKALCDCE